MIKLISRFTVKENCYQEVFDIFSDVVTKTRKNDTGFSEYDVYRNSENPLDIYILEVWDSKEALDAHSAQDYVKSMGERLSPYMENIEFGFYEKII